MIHGLQFKRDYRGVFRKGDIIPFAPGINMIVGDQGTGKSTLIELIRSSIVTREMRERQWSSIAITEQEAKETITVVHDTMRMFARDFERDSGRNSTVFIGDIGCQLADMKSSHGEASMRYLLRLPEIADRATKDALLVVMLDEPDANLSPRSAYELVRILRKLDGKRVQVIASVHNPIIIAGTIPGDDTPGWGGVFSLESKDWIAPAIYLESQAKPRERPAVDKPPPKTEETTTP